jgi:predicted transposase/invertase (TIGR01784 family)
MDSITFRNLPSPVGSPAWIAEKRAKAEGKAEGKLENKSEIASKLLEIGMSVQQVVEITGLDKHIVEELLKKI